VAQPRAERSPAGTRIPVDNPAVVEEAAPLVEALRVHLRSAARVVVIVEEGKPAARAPYPEGARLEGARLEAARRGEAQWAAMADSAPELEHSPPHRPNQRREHKAIPA